MPQCTRGSLHTCDDVARIVSITTRGYLSHRAHSSFPDQLLAVSGPAAIASQRRGGGHRQKDKTDAERGQRTGEGWLVFQPDHATSPPVKKRRPFSVCVCAIVVVPFLSRMPLQLYDLPFDMLEMIGQSYDDLAVLYTCFALIRSKYSVRV